MSQNSQGSQGLYMEDGSFMPFQREDLISEIANRQNALSFSSASSAWFGQLPDPDPILRRMGEDSKILEDLLADDQVITAITGRKNRVLNAPEYGYNMASLDGAEPDAKQKLIYEKFTQDLERLKLRSLISSILDAPFFGMTPLEIIWESLNGWWHIKEIHARPYYWFAYNDRNTPFFKGEGNLNAEQTPLPAGKFIMVNHSATYDNPYGVRLLSRCLWAVSFKRGGTKFYAKFIEKFGLPWVIGKAPRGASDDEKRAIAVNLARMVEDAVAVIPQGAEVQLISPSGQETNMHESFLSRQDRSISKILMGQTLTVEMEGKNNSQAAASTHQDVATGIAESDKAMVCDAMNEIAWIYTMLNAGESVLAPVFSYQEPKDLQERATLDKELFGLGVRFTHNHFMEEYGLKEDEFTLKEEVESEKEINPNEDNNIEDFGKAEKEEEENKKEKQGEKPKEKPREKPEEQGKEKDSKEDSKDEKQDKDKDEKKKRASFSAQKKEKQDTTFHEQIKNQTAFDSALKNMLPNAIKANDTFLEKLFADIAEAESFEEMELMLIEKLGSEIEMSELENVLSTSMTQAASFGMYSVQKEIEK